MIKRICFASRRAHVTRDDFQQAWLEHVALARHALSGSRPVRVVAGLVLQQGADTSIPHDGVSMEWFEDRGALQRFEAWLHNEDASAAIEPGTTHVIHVDELVLRGRAWLEQHWAQPSVKFKHMALARRAAGLNLQEFSTRWRSKAGTVAGSGQAPITAIPPEAKGCAYIQNHPLPMPNGAEWRYDAINEVYFDELAAMRARIELFAKLNAASAEAALVREATFVVVREHPIAMPATESARACEPQPATFAEHSGADTRRDS